jgi:transposase
LAFELYKQGIHLISVDEKPGIQALERKHPTHPPSSGKVALREHEYERHGTLCLTANFEVATGKVIAPTLEPTRTEEDFLNHIKQTIAHDPQGSWIFIADQLNTHKSQSLVEWVAEQCHIQEDLGIKGKSGILQSMATRKEFLSREEHRIRFVYTPKHSSWLNQIECWFSILVRRLLKRASFASIEEMKIRIIAFIEYFNQTIAKPFKWTYKGRPLTI